MIFLSNTLKDIVYDTLNFDCPIVKVNDSMYSLELFHGPTLAFKDVGGRFMARLASAIFFRDSRKKLMCWLQLQVTPEALLPMGFMKFPELKSMCCIQKVW